MARKRTDVPPDTAVDLLFASDRTCCICREPRKAVQIHHLDEDPSNHSTDNLAVLCLDCHDQTQVRGGFGRTLSAGLVRRYRKDWEAAVEARRAGSHGINGPVTVGAADQARLDALLGLLCRQDIRVLGEQNFAASWPDTVTTPFEVLIHERNDVEHRFTDPVLEEHRVVLVQAAQEFLGREAIHGFMSDADPRRRIPGYSAGDAEGFPEREGAMKDHQAAIAAGARRLLDAHDALVTTAMERGYDVAALQDDRHPRVQQIHDRLAEDDRRWRSRLG